MRLLIKLAYLPFIICFWPFYFMPLSISFFLVIVPERGPIWFALIAIFAAELVAAKITHRAVTDDVVYFYLYGILLALSAALAIFAVLQVGDFGQNSAQAGLSLFAIITGRISPVAFFRFRSIEGSAPLKNIAKFGSFGSSHEAFLRAESKRVPNIYVFFSFAITAAFVFVSVFVPAFSQNGSLMGDFHEKAIFAVFPFLAFFMLGAHCFFIYHPNALWREMPNER
ncbi:MAG: hypothetical protein ROO70_03680 [Labrenzia sp.]